MEIFSANKQVGDYILLNCLRDNPETRTWCAQQVSVGRAVLIDELKESHAGHRGVFLSDVRAKASVEHPLVGSIYEASSDRNYCFFAYELLPGKTVTELAQEEHRYKAQKFVQLLRRVAEANIYHETRNNATSPLGPDNIHVDDQGIVRLDNLVIQGNREAEHSTRDIVQLGNYFRVLLDPSHPGTTRCITLLTWMRGEDTEHFLTWSQIRDYCEQIEQQLTEPSEIYTVPTAEMPVEKKGMVFWACLTAGVLMLGFITWVAVVKLTGGSAPAESNTTWIEIQPGSYTTPDGTQFTVTKFSISNKEVTIGEYAKFLKTLDVLSRESNDHVFDHPDQPEDKTSHEPTHWADLYKSAKDSKVWNERKLNLSTPVVGVDWWDAYAYARWKKCFLPTQEQWLAALMSETKDISAIPVSTWPPTTETPDRTENNILAMSGSVSEWTAEPRVSPSNPLGKPQWVIMGGSYLKPNKGALSQEWIEDRSARRPDLGFRICHKEL